MITIDFQLFMQDDLDAAKDSCTDFIETILGPPDKPAVIDEEESLLFNYSKYTLTDFEFYDELMDFARETELYVIVYDHDIKTRRGFWFDEYDEWIEQEMGNNSPYTL